MSHAPAVLLVFPYIETVIQWLALSAPPLLGLLWLMDRVWPASAAETVPLQTANERKPD